MALDKLVDSTQLDSDLGTVADGIRYASGGSEQLSFPSGMAAAARALKPSGTKQIITNGTHNVAGFASAQVNVPTPAPTGTKQISITENGTTTEDVAAYANAEITVNVSGDQPVMHGYWTRPSNWPNYESLHMENDPTNCCVYLTYDTRPNKSGILSVGLVIYTAPAGTIARIGRIENGEFTPIRTLTRSTSSPNFLETFFPSDDDYVAVELNLNNVSSGRITFQTDRGVIDSCVEVYGRPGNVAFMDYNTAYYGSFGPFIQSVTLLDYETATSPSISSFYSYAKSLQYINLSDFVLTRQSMDYSSFARLPQIESLVFPESVPDATNISSAFSGAVNLLTLDLSMIDVSSVTNFANAFYMCVLLNVLNISGWDMQSATNTTNMFTSCSRLTSLVTNGTKIYTSFSVSPTSLDHDSLVGLLNALQPVTATQTITLGATLQAKLTNAEIAIATEKGWTVA